MKNVLWLNSSLNSKNGQSYKLSKILIDELENKANYKVSERDLAAEPLPHLSQEEFQSWLTPVEDRTNSQSSLSKLSDSLVKELQGSDILVVGLPMYNFGIPSSFKAWIDRVARAGITFRYTENGPEGLLSDKKVIVVATRGGQYQGTPKDTQTQYIKDVFAFIGLNDVDFVYAEGVAMQDAEASIQNARTRLENMAKLL